MEAVGADATILPVQAEHVGAAEEGDLTDDTGAVAGVAGAHGLEASQTTDVARATDSVARTHLAMRTLAPRERSWGQSGEVQQRVSHGKATKTKLR